ncbi:hypothetical protein EJB05_28667, partial [Eragrostis curvula]
MPMEAAAASMRGTEAGTKNGRRLVRVLVGRRRRAAVLLLALAYVAAILMLVLGGGAGMRAGSVVAVATHRRAPAPPGSLYRSHLVFERLLPDMRAFVSRTNPLVASHTKKTGKRWAPCRSKNLTQSELPPSNGFLIVEANGGLNQQRISICDAVVVARMLNATLVTPAFHVNSVWRDARGLKTISVHMIPIGLPESLKLWPLRILRLPYPKLWKSELGLVQNDCLTAYHLHSALFRRCFRRLICFLSFSKFGDIFDEDHFIESLRKYVRVIKELPEDIFLQFDHNISMIPNMRTKAFSSPSYYLQQVLPKLLELGAVRIAPFSNRLAHSVPSNIQALRCLANYEALRFSEPIRIVAENMVDRMMKRSTLAVGKYVSVHLRFEEDMVAFSCCKYDGGLKENIAMENARERSWRGKFHRPGRVINPEANRRNGRCPLTPLEVGMMLRGMGFDNTTSLYVASGKIYNAEKYMTSLRQLFPLLQTKETLATPEELAQFKVP